MPTTIGQSPKYKKNIALDKIKPLEFLSTRPSVRQSQRMHFFSVIKMNSTYIDVVNKFYTHKGHHNAANLYFFGFAFITLILIPLYGIIIKGIEIELFGYFLAFCLVFPFFILYPLLTNYKPDNGNYTHYPIRFNRKNRKVYFLDMDGHYQVGDWGKMKFCIVRPNSLQGDYEIWGVILNHETQLIEHTVAIGPPLPLKDAMQVFWNVIAVFMCDGPQELYPDELNQQNIEEKGAFSKITFCNDIDEKRESAAFSRYRVDLNSYGAGFLYVVKMVILETFFWKIGRVFAMKTCKVPLWPDWIKQECIVEVDDPYIVDASINKKFNFHVSHQKVYVKD